MGAAWDRGSGGGQVAGRSGRGSPLLWQCLRRFDHDFTSLLEQRPALVTHTERSDWMLAALPLRCRPRPVVWSTQHKWTDEHVGIFRLEARRGLEGGGGCTGVQTCANGTKTTWMGHSAARWSRSALELRELDQQQECTTSASTAGLPLY